MRLKHAPLMDDDGLVQLGFMVILMRSGQEKRL